jgi:hypothetical protein
MLDRRSHSPAAVRALRRARGRLRQARYRQRQADGVVLVEIAVMPSETEKLFRYRFLSEHELEDRKAIDEALHALIERLP